jgi:NADPH-dependent 2,4-dienoyl-CoA reductase/sulfur reductase-like enzyme
LLTIHGAGMAGLAAAARCRELGVPFRLVEKGDRPGGSMLLSSCVIWRYDTLERFREECPGGDPELQRLVVERLDDAIAWLESLGAEPVWRRPGTSARSGSASIPSR